METNQGQWEAFTRRRFLRSPPKDLSTPEKGVAKEKEATRKAFSRCFRCEGGHRVRDCPQKQALNKVNLVWEDENNLVQLSSLNLVNAMQLKSTKARALQKASRKLARAQIQRSQLMTQRKSSREPHPW
ncbi:hypothetical protein AMTR_s00151p00095170 [Amborella trichopoda]|uniref:Uncharacterized protein n=1 Tax=Amborella trichopoda TaxID=13333 RepID=W1NIB3_AMBTC|nr:hypothetical protein AMTR_s00151p00095170 [Amborella trichopoda]